MDAVIVVGSNVACNSVVVAGIFEVDAIVVIGGIVACYGIVAGKV